MEENPIHQPNEELGQQISNPFSVNTEEAPCIQSPIL